MDEFAHLRVHSAYTLSEGASKIEALVKRAVDISMPAIALTDRENLFGVMVFSKETSLAGVQPIVGCQMSLEFGGGKHGNVILLAQNAEGYANLCALLRSVSDPRPDADGHMINPSVLAVDPEALELHSSGLILLTGGGRDGLMPKMLAYDPEAAKEGFRWLLSIFGDRLYTEICRNETPGQEAASAEDLLIDLAYGSAGETMCWDGIIRSTAPLVATSDIWYASHDRHEAWLVLNALVNKTPVMHTSKGLEDNSSTRYHMRTSQEMKALFLDIPEAYDNAANIARRCAFMAKGRKPTLPSFPCLNGRDEATELCEQSMAGLQARLDKLGIKGKDSERYWKRMDYELGVITKMGFPGYFLIVSDFIKWAKAQDIPVGPGRGSGAGSIVAWALTITGLDPLEFNLLFERFLNPDRISMPDFDIDFCQERREEVRDYVKKKYGSSKVALISTFNKLKSKGALSDLQRIFEDDQLGRVNYREIKELTALIPKKEEGADPMDLMEAYEKDPAFKACIDGSDKLALLFRYAQKIEGLIKSSGSHAAGVVIGDRALDTIVPISHDAKSGMDVCNLNMKGVEEAGLVKFDFLGLTNLTIMRLCMDYIREFNGIDIDIEAIPRNDPQVYQMLAKAKCTAVFQFEGHGMRDVMRQISPTCFEDLIAIVALYRPGPMGYIADYARRKDGENFEYPGGAEKTEDVLKETYGIMVYQEQVMQVAQRAAGYSLGGADLLRRAMGKKDTAEMARQKRIFIHGDNDCTPPVPGAVKLGMSEAAALKLFDDIKPFADYGFNKSHAAAYALIGYQTAWLKCHYPAAYLSAVMSYCSEKRLTIMKDELDAMGVPLLPPDINKSHAKFRPEPLAQANGGFAVRFGLQAIKQISGASADLVGERAKGGVFTSIEDFHYRVGARYNKAHYEYLCEAGAFDNLARSRRQASDSLAWLALAKDRAPVGQIDMFGGVSAVKIPQKVLEVPEWDDIAEREFKAVGFYLTKHPLDHYAIRLIAGGIRRRKSFAEYMCSHEISTLKGRKLCVMVNEVMFLTTKNNLRYLRLFVGEKDENYGVTIFSNRDGKGPGIDDLKAVLDGAKTSRRPVVLFAELEITNNFAAPNVLARDVMVVDDYLENIRSEILISMDAQKIPLPKNLVRVAREQTETNTPVQNWSANPMENDREIAIQCVVSDIILKFETHGRSEDRNATAVRIDTGTNVVVLEGRYKMSQNLENVLKGVAGVVSVKEVAVSVKPLQPLIEDSKDAVETPRVATRRPTAISLGRTI